MSPECQPLGPITQFLADDHRRLEQLLHVACDAIGGVEQRRYDQFRAGLLRHIGMEEKILLPMAQRLNGGVPLTIAAKLRYDHGAIAALLMPTPTPRVLGTLRTVLDAHNLIEEGLGGVYQICDQLAGHEADHVMAQLQAAPEVTVLPHSDTPAVLGAVQRAVERAGHTFLLG